MSVGLLETQQTCSELICNVKRFGKHQLVFSDVIVGLKITDNELVFTVGDRVHRYNALRLVDPKRLLNTLSNQLSEDQLITTTKVVMTQLPKFKLVNPFKRFITTNLDKGNQPS